MKKIILLLAFSMILGGCAAEKSATIEPNTNTKTSEAKNETNSLSETDKSSETAKKPPLSGEKIEKPLEVKFESSGLPSGWEKVDTNNETPADFDTKDGVLKLKIPGGTDLFGSQQNAPRLLKPISGDFEIETKVKFNPKVAYQGAGILIWNDEKNYLRLERGFGGTDGGESGVRFDKSVNGDYSAISGTEQNATESGEVELKLVRKGKQFTAFVRENIDGEWKEIGNFSSDYPETIQAGIIGVSTADDITAEFAYIRMMPIGK